MASCSGGPHPGAVILSFSSVPFSFTSEALTGWLQHLEKQGKKSVISPKSFIRVTATNFHTLFHISNFTQSATLSRIFPEMEKSCDNRTMLTCISWKPLIQFHHICFVVVMWWWESQTEVSCKEYFLFYSAVANKIPLENSEEEMEPFSQSAAVQKRNETSSNDGAQGGLLLPQQNRYVLISVLLPLQDGDSQIHNRFKNHS